MEVVVVVPLGNYFLLFFCGGPLDVETPGQLPSLPPSPLNPTLLLLLRSAAGAFSPLTGGSRMLPEKSSEK